MTLLRKLIPVGFIFILLLTLSACTPEMIVIEPTVGTVPIKTASSMPISHQMVQSFVGQPQPQFDTETYKYLEENGFKDPLLSPLSTFSIDVDTASYSNVRRMLRDNQFPKPGAVRIEEMINYFGYDYPQPAGENPVAVYQELTECPWDSKHFLLHIGLQAKAIDMKDAPQSNLVFLVDVSGSMYEDLELVKSSLKMLTAQMNQDDRISIVAYAGAAGIVLQPTPGSDRKTIENALDQLESGGSTDGGEGIELAYDLAEQYLVKGGNNRIILATDGDFNVGLTSEDALVRLIKKKRNLGIYLTVLGFGMLNYDDITAEALADHGNGNYAYIDNLLEAKKVLVNEIGGTLLTVAKDVKLQVEFNPTRVKFYRLIGYENRLLETEDFTNDKKDAGDMGAGHTVTALYEIIPQDGTVTTGAPLRYQQPTVSADPTKSGELALVKYRYKKPDEETSNLLSFTVPATPASFSNSTDNQRFAAAVAAWGMLLRNSEFKGNSHWDWVTDTARTAKGIDPNGDRAEFIKLVELAKILEQKRSE